MEQCFELASASADVNCEKKYLVRLQTVDRKEEKTFCSAPVVEDVIRKANHYGCDGSKLLLASDGCEVCDNEAFLHYLVRGAKFMVTSDARMWQSNGSGEIADSPEVNAGVPCTSITICKQPQQQQQRYEPHRIAATPQSPRFVEWQRSLIDPLPPSLTVVVASEPIFKEVDVPWHIIPPNIRESLQAGEPLGRQKYTLSQLLVEELRRTSPKIPLRVLRVIAHRVVMRYPKSFQRAGQPPLDLLSIVLQFALIMQRHNEALCRVEEGRQKRGGSLICEDVGDNKLDCSEALWSDYSDVASGVY